MDYKVVVHLSAVIKTSIDISEAEKKYAAFVNDPVKNIILVSEAYKSLKKILQRVVDLDLRLADELEGGVEDGPSWAKRKGFIE